MNPSPVRPRSKSRIPLCGCILSALLAFQYSVQAAQILYVQDLGQRDTAKLANLLIAQGHDVTILNTGGGDTVGSAESYQSAGYDLLIVDEVISSGAVDELFNHSPIPVISSEAYLYRNDRTFFNTSTGGGSNFVDAADAISSGAPYGQIMGETAINITNTDHPLAAGLAAGAVDVFDPSVDRDKYPLPEEGTTGANGRHDGVLTFITTDNATSGAISGITTVAEVPGGPDYAAIFCVEPGEMLSDGSTNLARWIHLPWNDTLDGRILQEPAFFLFEAAVAYALEQPEPTKIRDLTDPAVFAATDTVISFSVDKTTAGESAVATDGISLSINGTDMTGDLVIADGGDTWDASYSGGLAANEVFDIVASATAADGGTSARHTQLDTLDATYLTVEAEDYNYTENEVSGLFFDNPMLCAEPGGLIDNCYYDRVSLEGVDRQKGNNRLMQNTPFNLEIYRLGPVAGQRDEDMDTYVSFDWAVQARAERVSSGIADYEVRNVGQGDWQNYTRTYPTGKYNVYLRLVSAAAGGEVQLEMVDDPVDPFDITLLGSFLSSGIGAQTVALTDAGGTSKVEIDMTSTSATTLRLTQISDGFNIQGYFVLVPTEPGQPEVVITLEPLGILPSGAFGLLISGPSGASGQVQRAGDVVDWQNWMPFTLGDSPLQISDSDTSSNPSQFYRAVTP